MMYCLVTVYETSLIAKLELPSLRLSYVISCFLWTWKHLLQSLVVNIENWPKQHLICQTRNKSYMCNIYHTVYTWTEIFFFLSMLFFHLRSYCKSSSILEWSTWESFFCIERGDRVRITHKQEQWGGGGCVSMWENDSRQREGVSEWRDIWKKYLQKIADNTVVYFKQKIDHVAADHLHALCNCFLWISGR